MTFYSFDARAVAAVLGGEPVVGPVSGIGDLRHAVIDGLPVDALDAVTQYVARTPEERTQLMKLLALNRRRARMTISAGERVVRVAHVALLAEHVWEDQTLAKDFLWTRQTRWKRSALELCRTDLGAREVAHLLASIEFSLPA